MEMMDKVPGGAPIPESKDSGMGQDDAKRIADLEATLKACWALFAMCYLMGETPDEIKRSRAFTKLDKHLRKLGIVGPTTP